MRAVFKYTLRILGSLVLLIILAAILLPLLFKNQIIESVRRSVDRRIEGDFHFEKAQVGLLRTFPHFCLKLKSPLLTGTLHPDGDSLYSANALDVVVDIKSLLRKGPIKVIGIKMVDPRVSLYTDTAGITNYQLIANEDTLAKEQPSDPLVIEIEDYRIQNGRFRYIDEGTAISITAVNFDHRGSLRYEQNNIALKTQTSNAIVTLITDGIAYLDSVHVKGNNDLDLDMTNSVYTLTQNTLSLNALEVDLDGVVSQSEEKTSFDLTFAGERNTFKNLISLLPNIYSSGFDGIDASGNIGMEGTLKGDLTEATVPVYKVNLIVDEGAFQYPGKPLGFKDISFHGTLFNSAEGWQPVDIDLPAFHFLLNERPFDLVLHIQNPTGNGTYEGTIKGILDLGDFYQAYPLPQLQQLQGVVNADAEFDIGPARPVSDQHATGQLLLQNIVVASQGEELKMQTGNIAFTPAAIRIATQSATWNGGALQADLNVTDYIAWLSSNQPMTIQGGIALEKLDVNKYLTDDSDTGRPSSPVYPPGINLIRFDGTVAVNTLIYDTYVIENGKATVRGTLPALEVERLLAKVNGTGISASGKLSDIHTYINGSSPLVGSFTCDVDTLYIDRWIEDDAGDPTGSGSAYVQLPGDVLFDITFTSDGILYDQLRIRNASGKVHLEDHAVEIHNFKGTSLGGQMAFSGVYDTKDVRNPAFSMKYDLKSIRFSEAFNQVSTFKAIAPIAQFLQGAFNSTLVLEGQLGNNYIPDFNSLNASGYLETITAMLQNLDILKKVSEFLNLKKPLQWDFANTRNWFEVKNGYVILKEDTRTIDGIEVALGGRHKIQGEMDYLFKFNIPADRVTSNPVGALAQAGYEELQKKAAAYGVKLNTIESFVAHVGMKGTLRDPKFSLQLFDASGKSLKEVAAEQLIDIKEQIRDTLTEIADKKIEEVRDSIRNVIDNAVDSARKEAEERLREAGKEVLSGATEKLDSTMRDSITQAVLDKIGDKAMDKIEEKETGKIKDAIEKWDPFKKKKNQ